MTLYEDFLPYFVNFTSGLYHWRGFKFGRSIIKTETGSVLKKNNAPGPGPSMSHYDLDNQVGQQKARLMVWGEYSDLLFAQLSRS